VGTAVAQVEPAGTAQVEPAGTAQAVAVEVDTVLEGTEGVVAAVLVEEGSVFLDQVLPS